VGVNKSQRSGHGKSADFFLKKKEEEEKNMVLRCWLGHKTPWISWPIKIYFLLKKEL
jgi:hypothetical protein